MSFSFQMVLLTIFGSLFTMSLIYLIKEISKKNLTVHRYKTDYKKNGTRSKNVYYHVRRTFSLWKEEPREKKVFGFYTEIIFKKPETIFSWVFSVGNKGSETPFDGLLIIFGSGVYWGFEKGHRLASMLTSTKEHPYSKRTIYVRIFDGSLYWNFWAPSEEYLGTAYYRGWRKGSIALNPMTHIYGESRYTYTTIAQRVIDIQMPEGSYLTTVQLQEMVLKRPKSKRVISKSYILDVDAPKGIPTHYDRSGGWKGDRTYGFGVKIDTVRDPWEEDARNAISAWVHKERARTGFRLEQMQE